MSTSLEEWVTRLVQRELPVLRDTLQALESLRRDPNVSAVRIAATVLRDPMMTLKLMRLANATRGDELAQRISTAEHAVMMLGLSSTFSRLLETPAMEEVLKPDVQADFLHAVARACHAAAHAREWAVQRFDTAVEEVQIAALLNGIGEIALWAADPALMKTLAKACRKQPWTSAEREVLGFELSSLSLLLTRQWHMPLLVTSALQPAQVEAHARQRGIMLATRLLKDADMGWYVPEVVADIEDIAATRRLEPDEVAAQVHRTAADFARKRAFAGVTLSSAWLPMLPGAWPDEDAPTSAAVGTVPEADADPFQAVLDEISRHLDGTLTLHDLVVLVMRGMRNGIGLKRVVFALLSRDRTELQSKYISGAEEGSPLKSFRFDMRQKHIFSALMAKPQAIWMSADNRTKYAAYLNEEIRKTTSDHEFYAMSLSVHGKVVGLFYGDHAGAAKLADAASYEKFKTLCTQAALAMAHLAKSGAAAA